MEKKSGCQLFGCCNNAQIAVIFVAVIFVYFKVKTLISKKQKKSKCDRMTTMFISFLPPIFSSKKTSNIFVQAHI